MSYQPLLMNVEEAAELRKALGTDSLLGRALARDIKKTDQYMTQVGIEVPGHGEGGGYEHNRHQAELYPHGFGGPFVSHHPRR